MNRVFNPLICLLFSMFAGAQKVYTLQQCIDSAIKNYIPVQQAGLQKQAARIELSQARRNLLPNLNAEVNHGINSGRSIDPFTNTYVNQSVNTASYGVFSNLDLFNGFSLRNRIRQRSFEYEAVSMSYQQSKDQLVLDVILAYLDVLNSEDQVQLAIKRTATSQGTLERLNVLNTQGAIRPSDLSDMRGQVLEEQLNISNTKNLLENSKLFLAQLMNQPYDPEMKLERLNVDEMLQLYPSSANEVYQTALSQFSRVKAAEFNTKSFEYFVKATRGQLFPSVAFGAGINTNYSSIAANTAGKIPYGSQLKNNRFTSMGIGVSIPIFNRSQVRNMVKLAQIDLKDAELEEKNIKRELHQQIDAAYLRMTNAFERYQLLTDQVKAYEESFRAAEIRFNSGVGTSIDYLITKNRLDLANINLINAKYSFVLRKRILDYYKGSTD